MHVVGRSMPCGTTESVDAIKNSIWLDFLRPAWYCAGRDGGYRGNGVV